MNAGKFLEIFQKIGLKEKARQNSKALFSLSIFLIVWEVASYANIVNPILLSSPLEIFKSILNLLFSENFIQHVSFSLKSIFWGLAISVPLGYFIGIMMGGNKSFNESTKIFVYGISATPIIILVPLIVIWFGFGITSKIVIVFLMTITPIILTVKEGYKNINKEYLDLSISFGSLKEKIMREVTFYETLPYLFSGIKVSIGRSIIGVILAELYGYGEGLGYLVSYFSSNLQISKVMAVIAILILINYSIIGLIYLLEKNMIKWKYNEI